MGKEINRTTFEPGDSARFTTRLEDETQLLRKKVENKQHARDSFVAGFELEAWLLDRNCLPFPVNEEYLARLNDPLVVPELSKFNVELNGTPQPLRAGALRRLEDELRATWQKCLHNARALDGTIVAIGTLPTIRERDLCLANISPLNRYYALNEQVLISRGITVNAIAPGIIASPMSEAVFTKTMIDQLVPMKRAGTPDEVADLAAYLASACAGYISGQIISINGAMI